MMKSPRKSLLLGALTLFGGGLTTGLLLAGPMRATSLLPSAQAQTMGQAGDNLVGRAVGQAAKDHIHAVPIRVLDRNKLGQLEAPQMRVDRLHGLPGLGVGGQELDGGARMAGQQTHQIGAGIAAGAEDPHPDDVIA